jgi:ubiquinone/menaquinone biosynthesis C-methylase UbiE
VPSGSVRYDPDYVSKSGFHDVDQNDPARLVASLDRRSTAQLYEPYRTALLRFVLTTTGLILDVGAGGGHLVDRIAAAYPDRDVLGVDPSAALVAAAHAAGRPVLRSTGSALPFQSATAGCVIAERVLQHVYDVPAVLVEMDRVLQRGGLLLLVDPDHPAVRLEVPHLQGLADHLVRWRARAGTVSPAAAELSRSWLEAHGYSVSQETFWCSTADFTAARVITNFPEWAKLARDAGENVSTGELDAWEEHWRRMSGTQVDASAWFDWPIVLTAATRPGPN